MPLFLLSLFPSALRLQKEWFMMRGHGWPWSLQGACEDVLMSNLFGSFGDCSPSERGLDSCLVGKTMSINILSNNDLSPM